MQLLRPALRCAALCALSTLVTAGTPYRVTLLGTVDFNGIVTGGFSSVQPGDSTELSFLVDDDDWVEGFFFPTRGYVIDQSSWTFEFPTGSFPLQTPFPGTPYFVLRDNDPDQDGFFISTNIGFWSGVSLDEPGTTSNLESNFNVTYDQSLLSSLEIDGAAGVHNMADATFISWTIDDGTSSPMGITFTAMIVVKEVEPTVTPYGCGVNPAASLTLLSGEPVLGDVVEFGVDNPLGTQAAGSMPFVLATLAPAPGFPCGIPIPGLGMGGPAATGELLLTLAIPTVLFSGAPWTGPGVPAPVDVPIPFDVGLVGVSVYFQGLMFDPIAASGVDWGLTTAIETVIGN